MALRSWRKRNVSFGLVNFEVALKPLNGGGDSVSANRVDRDSMTQVKQAWIKDDGTISTDVISAYRTEAGFVEVDPKQFKVKGDTTIELTGVCDVSTIDPIYYDTTYVAWPTKGNEVAYDLLVTALRESGKAAVGKVVLTTSTKLLVLRWSEATGTIVAHTCSYDANIRWDEVTEIREANAARPAPDKEHLKVAKQLIKSLEAPFDTDGVADDYAAALKAAVEAAAEGKPIVIPEAVESAPAGDLMAQLQASLEKPAA